MPPTPTDGTEAAACAEDAGADTDADGAGGKERARAELVAARKGLGGFAFAANSTADKGRFSVLDADLFDSSTFFRKRDTGTRARGVTLVVGNLEDGGSQKVCSVLFDREHFTEGAAAQWWEHNCSRFTV